MWNSVRMDTSEFDAYDTTVNVATAAGLANYMSTCIHEGDDSEYVAKRVTEKKATKQK